MNYYLTRALDAPEKGMTRAEIFKKNDGDYGIFLNKPKLVQNERVQGGYDNDTTFVAGNSKHAQKISSHCTEDWENFTDFKLKGEVCKKIKKMVPILGGRTRYIVRGKDKDRDIVFILMRSDTKRKAPDHAYTMRILAAEYIAFKNLAHTNKINIERYECYRFFEKLRHKYSK